MKKSLHRISSILITILLIIGFLSNPATSVLGQSNTFRDAIQQSPTGWSLDYVGHLGGNTNAVTVQGDYAYIGEGGRLTILNIINPTLPTVIGKSIPLPGMIA